MTNISPEVLEEVEDCIEKIKTFLKNHNRRIHKSIKRVRSGHDQITELEQFNLPIPEDFRALYYNYSGAKPGGSLSMWEWSIFLEFYWDPIPMVVRSNKIMRLAKQNPLVGRIDAFCSPSGLTLQLDPGAEQSGKIPLSIALGTLSRNTYIAFDSTLDMLRSVCAAQDAGILRFEDQPNPAKKREKNELYYDIKELWDIIRPFNSRANYWTTKIADAINWDRIKVEQPKDGVIHLDPEVKKLILGDPQDYLDSSNKQTTRARKIPKNTTSKNGVKESKKES